MYESPITLNVADISSQIRQAQDGRLMYEVQQAIGYEIDKEELIKALKYDRDQYQKGYEDGRNDNEWIPVSERLPEEETDVLVCNINGDIEISCGSYSTEIQDYFMWYTSGWRFGEVLAWQPLPEPYKTESEVK